jgi:hypothetical protein
MAVINCKSLTITLAPQVEEVLKSNFGNEYSLGSNGEVLVKREKDAHPRHAGKWHLVNEEVCIIVTK